MREGMKTQTFWKVSLKRMKVLQGIKLTWRRGTENYGSENSRPEDDGPNKSS